MVYFWLGLEEFVLDRFFKRIFLFSIVNFYGTSEKNNVERILCLSVCGNN